MFININTPKIMGWTWLVILPVFMILLCNLSQLFLITINKMKISPKNNSLHFISFECGRTF